MDAWATVEEIAAARSAIEGSIVGWQAPVAYGVARIGVAGMVWAHVNAAGGTHQLPALVLATVCGHIAGTATYELARSDLEEAVHRLSPAEACTAFDHPNLWSWRRLLAETDEADRFVAVFVGDLVGSPVDEVDEATRALVDAVSTESVAAIAASRDAALVRLKAALAADPRVEAAWLCGSFGRGEADAWSDLDLYVALRDDAVDAAIASPRELFEIAGDVLLVQAGWPSEALDRGRFWLVVYDELVEIDWTIDWTIGSIANAQREANAVVLVDRSDVPVAEPPASPSAEAVAALVRERLAFFWAMAPIGLKYAGRGHTRNALGMASMMTGAYEKLWHAVHAPDRLGVGRHHQNLAPDDRFAAVVPRRPASVRPVDAAHLLHQLCIAVEALRPMLGEAGESIDQRLVTQVLERAQVAAAAASAGGTSPQEHSRR